MGIPHACQRNQQFADIFPYFVQFVFDNIDIQVLILNTVYANQTVEEQLLDETIFGNGMGFAKGVDTTKYSAIAKKWQQAQSYEVFDKTELAKLSTIHRYYPQCYGTIELMGTKELLQALDDRYKQYAAKCVELENDIANAKTEKNANIDALEAVKKKIGWGYPLARLRRDFETAQNQMILFDNFEVMQS